MKKLLLFILPILLWGMTAECQNTQSNSGNMDQNFLREMQHALKSIFSDKEILNNYNGAVVKDGEIVELTRANEDNGILFWHEHSPEWQGIVPEGVCRVYDPSWTGITNNTPAGLLKYQMLPTSIYANQTPQNISLSTCVNSPEAINAIEEINPQESIYSSAIDFSSYCISSSSHTSVVSMFVGNQLIYDNPHYAGAFNGDVTFYRPSGMGFNFNVYNSNFLNTYYSQTEYSNSNNQPIYTLKSGNYIPLLMITFGDPNDNDKKFYILKWLNLTVENYYLGDVGVENHDAQQVQMAVYPNPTTGFVNVQFTMNNGQLADAEIQMFDMYGRRLQVVGMPDARISDARGASVQTAEIDLSQYAPGIYLVKLVNGGKVVAVRKVVKE